MNTRLQRAVIGAMLSMPADTATNTAGNKEAHVNTNPLSQDISAQLETKLVQMGDVNFHFRTTDVPDPDKIDEIDPKTGKQPTKEWKRPTLKMSLPLLTKAGLIAALEADDKTTQFMIDIANTAITDRMRGLITKAVDDDATVELKPEQFDLNNLTLVAIANLPKGERGAGIPKEDWISFGKDYKATMSTPEATDLMPDKTARSPEVLDKHVTLITGKFNQIRSRKDTVKQMLGFLDIWAQVTKNGDEHVACYEHLLEKGKTIMEGEDFSDL